MPRGIFLSALRWTEFFAFAVAGILHGAGIAPNMLLLAGAVSGGEIVVVGERATLLRSTDQARTWQTAGIVPSGGTVQTATLTGVAFAPGGEQVGWAVGHDALILGSVDHGRTWQKSWQGENLADSFLDVLALDSEHVIAVGADGLFVETLDGGRTWKRRKLLDNDYHLNRLTRGPTGTLYLAGEHGTLLRSQDAGETWRSIGAPYDGSFYGVLPLDARTLVAHGLRGRIFRSEDDGETWQVVAMDRPALIAAALELHNGALLFAGPARAFYVSRDRARTAVASIGAVDTAVSALLELPGGRLLALGEAGATVIEVGQIIPIRQARGLGEVERPPVASSAAKTVTARDGFPAR